MHEELELEQDVELFEEDVSSTFFSMEIFEQLLIDKRIFEKEI